MCALKSPMSQVMLNTSVMAITDKSDPLTNFRLGGGRGYGPPCSAASVVGKTVFPMQFLHSSILYKTKFLTNIG